MTASLARFEHIGASIAAADTMLLGAQHAYDRGDITEMKRLAQEARDVYPGSGGPRALRTGRPHARAHP